MCRIVKSIENYETEISKLNGTVVATDGYAYAIVLRIVESKTGWSSVGHTPYEADLIKVQTGGYDNGPWPSDNRKSVPLRHILTIMSYEGLSFKEALKTQFSNLKTFLVDETIYEAVKAAADDAVKKVRCLLMDQIHKIHKMDSRQLFKLARQLK